MSSNSVVHDCNNFQTVFHFGGAIVDHAGGRIDDQLLHLLCGKEAAEVQITAAVLVRRRVAEGGQTSVCLMYRGATLDESRCGRPY